MSPEEAQEVAASGEQLPQGMVEPGLLTPSNVMVNPVFDGEQVVDGQARKGDDEQQAG